MIRSACSACLATLSVKHEHAGKQGRCPGCGRVLCFPAAAAVPPSRAEDARQAILVAVSDEATPSAKLNAGVGGRKEEALGRAWLRAVAAGARRRPGRLLLPAVMLLAVLALLPLGWYLASVVFRPESASGTLVIEIDDPEAEARGKGGTLVLYGPDGKVRYTLAPGDRSKDIAAGDYQARVEGVDSLALDTPEFTLRKGGRLTVRVRAVPKDEREAKKPAEKPAERPAAKVADLDRRAAEWVLSIGGRVRLNNAEDEVKAAAGLPARPFRLTGIDLTENGEVTDAGLAHFAECMHLTEVGLGGTRVSDKGVSHFEGCKDLKKLYLWGTRVTDAGLAHFKGCKGLTNLYLDRTMRVGDKGLAAFKGCQGITALVLSGPRVTDAGLAYFKDCKNLTELALVETGVTDAGLAYFKGCKGLTILNLDGTTHVGDAGLAAFQGSRDIGVLSLNGTRVTDAGLAYFKSYKNLGRLELDGTRVTDAGLALFKGCKELLVLNLARTKVTDAGVAHFKNCKDLAQLDVRDTGVTAVGVSELKKALPGCRIEGGTTEQKIFP